MDQRPRSPIARAEPYTAPAVSALEYRPEALTRERLRLRALQRLLGLARRCRLPPRAVRVWRDRRRSRLKRLLARRIKP